MEDTPEMAYTDANRLKGLASPVRAAIYYRLATLTEATATRIAQDLNISPSLASYHLRELAKYHFVESFTPVSSDRRSRWWRIINRGVILPAPTDMEGDTRSLISEVESIVVNNHLEQLSRFLHSRHSWAPEWLDAAFSADFILRLSSHELRALYLALEAVVKSFEARQVSKEESTDEETTMVLLHGFPIRTTRG